MSFSFQLGHVEAVFGSSNDYRSFDDVKPEPNKILFRPINSDDITQPIEAIPLIRGFEDSIAESDQILYITINKINYYLGPINTKNTPSVTTDPGYIPRRNNLSYRGDLSHQRGDGSNMLYPEISVPKLSKVRNKSMDFPAVSNQIPENTLMYEKSLFTDLLLEGRFGNGIRLGARNQNPNLIISNNNIGSVETLGGGGSIFAMTSIGTIDDNFPTETHIEIRNDESVDVEGFRLSADLDDFNIGRGNYIVNEEKPENLFNYQYGYVEDYNPDEPITPNNEFDQVIISSDRIIFNSTVEDITISANRNINLGSNKNFTLNNKGFSVFQSPNIYIGEAAKLRDEPMVLGSQLQNLLVRILRLLGDAQALGDMNVPQKLTLFPNIHIAGTLSQEVNNIMQEFNLGTLEPGQNPNPEFEKNLDENNIAISDTISGNSKLLSNRHFIEPNE